VQDKLARVGTGAGPEPAAGSSLMTSVCVTPFAFPEIVALTDSDTGLVSILNAAVFAPAATATESGTVRAALLLVKDTDVDFVEESLK